MITAALLCGLVAGVLLSGYVSGAETGVFSVNPVRLRVASEQGQPAARRLERLLRRPENLVITMLLATNAAEYFVTACAAALLGEPDRQRRRTWRQSVYQRDRRSRRHHRRGGRQRARHS